MNNIKIPRSVFRKATKKQEEEFEQTPEVVSNHLEHPSSNYIKEDKMEIVPVEEKMNQVAQAAPSEIGHVIESEIDTNEESTSSEVKYFLLDHFFAS